MFTPGPILGIETSCDETAAAVASPDGRILSNIIFSQTLHAAYGGVVPELASREHSGRLPAIVTEALSAAPIGWGDLAGIAVTAGPGLVGCLLVGVAYARAAARARGIPLIGVNHLEGHAHTPALTDPELGYPQLVLIVSGGHTSLVMVEAPGQFQCLGRTRDDAAGECFDKVGKLLGFDYPAGPAIDRAGEDGAANAVAFPKTRFEGQGYDFSFSGIKTAAALDWDKRQRGLLPAVEMKDWVASFEQTIVDSLTQNLFRAADDQSIPTVALAGGVARNRRLRRVVTAWAERTGRHAIVPPPEWCADNAAMIAAVGSYRWQPDSGDAPLIDAVPNWGLGEPPPWMVTT
ncbi:MAG: tRNA (adenosine(37)-N6)-threonylcarbamoyltransferase complex transferase subunit TsaD [candidate division Zixibacteria bacterium]|nr:tRNA (adenosine(37)-N6)-threonylcarbamoyltransferase complex transferase subunit TsaD [candidate division Zixibacteria bacterium]